MTTNFTIQTVLPLPFDAAVAATREALENNGFGIITEIDMAGTFKRKLDVDTAPQIILGACRPQLAYEATQAAPAIAALLPCNVVVRSQDSGATVVEAIDPAVMGSIANEPALDTVIVDARQRLLATLDQLNDTSSIKAN